MSLWNALKRVVQPSPSPMEKETSPMIERTEEKVEILVRHVISKMDVKDLIAELSFRLEEEYLADQKLFEDEWKRVFEIEDEG